MALEGLGLGLLSLNLSVFQDLESLKSELDRRSESCRKNIQLAL